MSILSGKGPTVAVEIASQRVSAAAIESSGGRPVVTVHASEAFAPGALVPALVGQNICDAAAVTAAMKRVLEAVGRPRRVGLVLPDPVAKISLVRFAQLPARAHDLDELVRWQVRKAAPFPIEDAQVSHVPGLAAADGHEFIVSVARRAVIQEYEAVCAAAGAHAGLVDISTFNLVNAVLAGPEAPEGDWLLVNVAAEYTSVAILRGPDLIFFRSRGADDEGNLADLVHQTAMYYEDRLQGAGFRKVVLGGAATHLSSAEATRVRQSLEERIGTPVEAVREAIGFADRSGAGAGRLDALAPIVGLLLRDSVRGVRRDHQRAGA